MGEGIEGQRERDELVRLVAQIMKADFETEEQLDAALSELQSSVLDPRVTEYIYYWHRSGFDSEPSAAQIVDRALSYKPFAL